MTISCLSKLQLQGQVVGVPFTRKNSLVWRAPTMFRPHIFLGPNTKSSMDVIQAGVLPLAAIEINANFHLYFIYMYL